jgi:hypothetical protein
MLIGMEEGPQPPIMGILDRKLALPGTGNDWRGQAGKRREDDRRLPLHQRQELRHLRCRETVLVWAVAYVLHPPDRLIEIYAVTMTCPIIP